MSNGPTASAAASIACVLYAARDSMRVASRVLERAFLPSLTSWLSMPRSSEGFKFVFACGKSSETRPSKIETDLGYKLTEVASK